MEKLPASTSRGIFLSYWEMLIFYLIIGSGLVFFLMKRRYFLFLLLIGLILFNVSLLLRQMTRLTKARITIYNFRNMSAFDFTVQDKAILWYDFKNWSQFQNQFERNIATVENCWDEAGIRRKRNIWMGNHNGIIPAGLMFDVMSLHGCFFQFREKRIGILKEKIPKSLRSKISLDYLIISQDVKVNIAEILMIFKPGKLIIDGMNSAYRTKQWIEEAKRLGVPCHPVSRDGAFIEEI